QSIFSKYTRGLSLVELMVAVAILGGVLIGMLGILQIMEKGILASKSRTLVTNAINEELEILKSIPYDHLQVTTQNDLTIYGYDNTYYRPDLNLSIGGMLFNRYVTVRKVYEDATKATVNVNPTNPDTGLKKIEVLVTWTERNKPSSFSMASFIND